MKNQINFLPNSKEDRQLSAREDKKFLLFFAPKTYTIIRLLCNLFLFSATVWQTMFYFKFLTMIKSSIIGIMAGLFIGLNACDTNSVQKPKPIDVANMDLSANPGTDFNQYANGGWIASHPVPEDKSRYGSFDELMDENEKQAKNS